jgi:hypothetical protein
MRKVLVEADAPSFAASLRTRLQHAHSAGRIAAHPTMEEGGKRALPDGYQWCGKDMPGGQAQARRLRQMRKQRQQGETTCER